MFQVLQTPKDKEMALYPFSVSDVTACLSLVLLNLFILSHIM